MKGLIIKDLINLKRQGKILAVLIGFYVFLALTSENNSMLGGVLAVICGILPVTALAFDEKARWDKYALTMPVSRKDMVISKYLLGIILSIAALLINVTFNVLTGSDSITDDLLMSLVLFAVGILFLSLVLPILFKFGVEKGRLLMLLMLFLPTAFIVIFSKLGIKAPDEEVLNRVALASPFIVILIFAASIAISVKIYSHKEI